MTMKEICAIFGIVFTFGFLFFIPNEIKESKNELNYTLNHTVQSNKNITYKNISFDMDLRSKSINTAKDYNKILSGTRLQGLGETFKSCDEIGVNSLFVLALACHESNYGKSSLSRNKNNIFGFGAYDVDPYNSAKSFSSKQECITHVARYLHDNYLNEKGKFFNGYTISAINVNYASDLHWSKKIYNIMVELQNKILL